MECTSAFTALQKEKDSNPQQMCSFFPETLTLSLSQNKEADKVELLCSWSARRQKKKDDAFFFNR